MNRIAQLLALLLFRSYIVTAAIPSCGAGNLCPASAPCCSMYGECGVGAYCLGGCDPLFSHSLSSCVAKPTCESVDYKLDSLSDVEQNTMYLGDSLNTNWVAEGMPVMYNNNSILLTMAPDTVGSLLSSTHYVWYGKISATLRTSAGAGVVTAFIMMSDVKDEIDFEFVGADLQHAQSNYYFQGITNYTNELNIPAIDTSADTHTYTIDWQTDSIAWSVDGQVLRTLEKADTWNDSTGAYMFPQTPSRVMLSLWPAGIPASSPGTIEWAGGLIDWNSPYMQNGYYYAQVTDVTVQCYDPPLGANAAGSKAYVYNDNAGTNSSVMITNDQTVLASFYATGENEGYNPNAASSSTSSSSAGTAHSTSSQSTSATSSTAMPTDTDIQTVPGLVGAGNRGATAGSPSGSTSGSGNSSESGTSGRTGSGSSSGSFVQDTTTSSGETSKAGRHNEKAVRGSAFAVLVALSALITL